MTDETKQLFGAPWTAVANSWSVRDAHNRVVATTFNQADANRLSYLPELYDIAKTAIGNRCEACTKRFCLQCEVNDWKEVMKRIKEAR